MEDSKRKSRSRMDSSKFATTTQTWDAWCDSVRDATLLNSVSRRKEFDDDDCSVSSSSLAPGSEVIEGLKHFSRIKLVDPTFDEADSVPLTTRDPEKSPRKHPHSSNTNEDKFKVGDSHFHQLRTPDENKFSSRKRRNCYFSEEDTHDQDRKIVTGKRVAPLKDRHADGSRREENDGKSASKFDVASYLLGERSGFEKGVYQAKSDRDTLSSLSSKVKDLRICMLSEKERLKYVEINGKSMERSLACCVEKQKNFEQRLSKIEAELCASKSMLDKCSQLPESVSELKDKVSEIQRFQLQNASLSALQNKSLSSYARNFGYLIVSNLGQFDYLLSLFARKLILPNIQSVNFSIQSSDFKEDFNKDTQYIESRKHKTRRMGSAKKFDRVSFLTRIQNFFGVLLLISMIESIYFFHLKLKKRTPERFKPFTLPLHHGIRSVRFLLWTSIFLISSQELKRLSFYASGLLVRGISRIPKLFQTQKSRHSHLSDTDSSHD